MNQKQLPLPPMHVISIPSASAMREPVTEIPKIIWSFWHEKTPPEIVQLCISNWKRFNPDYRIELLNADNVTDFLSDQELPGKFQELNNLRKSDWLRLALVSKFGGFWLDASIFLTRSLEWIRAASPGGQAFVGFYLEGYTANPRQPVIESWAFAAPAGHPFVGRWLATFTEEVIESSDLAFLNKLRDAGVYERVVGNIESPQYLAIHVAAQYVLTQPTVYAMELIKAEDSAYLHHYNADWNRLALCWSLLGRRAPTLPAPLIKLRSKDRKRVATYLKWKLVNPVSIVARFLVHRRPGV